MTFPFSTVHPYTKMSKDSLLVCQVPRSSCWSYTPRRMVFVPGRPELGVCAHSVHKDRYEQFFLPNWMLSTHCNCTHTHTHTHTQAGHGWPVGCILVPPGLQDGNKASPKNVRTLSVVLACAWVHVQYSTTSINSWIISTTSRLYIGLAVRLLCLQYFTHVQTAWKGLIKKRTEQIA